MDIRNSNFKRKAFNPTEHIKMLIHIVWEFLDKVWDKDKLLVGLSRTQSQQGDEDIGPKCYKKIMEKNNIKDKKNLKII